MKHVVDSSAWLEFFADGPNAEAFLEPLSSPEQLIVPTITLYEVSKVVQRQRGRDAAIQVLAVMQQGREVSLDAPLAIQAAALGLELGLPMADSIILATARAHGATLWTQDEDFRDLDGVQYFPKPAGKP